MIKWISPRLVLKLMWLWPPYFFSGIRVISINDNMTEVVVQLKTRFWNKNYVGTHFGGSLYSMTDPFFMFILLHHLKEEHIVWDTSAEIQFMKATAQPVIARFHIPLEEIENIKTKALKEFKVQPYFNAEIRDPKGDVVAKVRKGLYVRRKDAKSRFIK